MLKRLAIVICLCVFCAYAAKAQINLVPNGSFEDTAFCPSLPGEVNKLKHWNNPTNATPDIISANYCNDYVTSNYINSPDNFWGFQKPRTGNNYAGIGLLNIDGTSINTREYIQVKLTSKLKPNQCYHAKFYVSLADGTAKYATKSIGISVSHNSTFEDSGDISYTPMLSSNISFENDEYLNDTVSWQNVEGNFTSTGGEEYLIIGCFKPQDSLDVVEFDTNAQDYNFIYYYIDDVSVYECDSTTGVNEDLKGEINIYPNPAKDFVSIDIPENYQNPQLHIYNLTGQLVVQKQIISNQQIPISELGNGMCIFIIQNGDKVIGRQRVVVAR